ncbi:MAG: glycosyltransferase family 1 protein [Candidatus Nanopelagicaceae bacterium]|nr:glycosyltransferase family 1 protein [Candidatus Nanopelagicaceae bacterium]
MITTLVVTNDFGPRSGGIETFIHGLLSQASKNQQRNFVVLTSRQTPEEEVIKFDRQMWEENRIRVIRDTAKVLLPTPRLAKKATALFIAHKCENVIFGSSAPLGLLTKSLRRAGAKHIVALTHGHEVWWARMPLFSALLRRIGAQADQMTYLGEFTRGAVANALLREDHSKLVHLPPGVDLTRFIPAAKSLELQKKWGIEGAPVIVSIGRLVPRKGSDQLIKAMPEALKHFPKSKLLLVGTGSYQKSLEKLVRNLKVQDSVIFTGRVAHELLPAYYRLGDIFAAPCRSRYGGLEVEGLGIVYLEASACGVPVIAGKSGGAPDAVLDGKTGILVNGRDHHEVTAALIKLLADEKLRAQMGTAGRAWMEQLWSWEGIGTRFEEIISD